LHATFPTTPPGIKPKAPGERLTGRRTKGAPLYVGTPLA
jgi:hypothetical protein